MPLSPDFIEKMAAVEKTAILKTYRRIHAVQAGRIVNLIDETGDKSFPYACLLENGETLMLTVPEWNRYRPKIGDYSVEDFTASPNITIMDGAEFEAQYTAADPEEIA